MTKSTHAPRRRPPSAVPSTPASPPRRGWSRSSTRSTPSASPAKPSSTARPTRAGPACRTATTTAASPAATWTGPPCKRLLADIEAGKVDCVVVYKVDRLSRGRCSTSPA